MLLKSLSTHSVPFFRIKETDVCNSCCFLCQLQLKTLFQTPLQYPIVDIIYCKSSQRFSLFHKLKSSSVRYVELGKEIYENYWVYDKNILRYEYREVHDLPCEILDYIDYLKTLHSLYIGALKSGKLISINL